jgi:NAD-dependent deacetylase
MRSHEKIIDLIRSSSKTVLLTGAGISTESGLPDFRSDNGFWTKNQPIQFKEFLMDKEQRRLSWLRNLELHKLLANLSPNSGHKLVQRIVSLKKNNALITQNIDGLHQKAGVKEDQIIEIHGNATKAACLSCFKENSIELLHNAVVKNLELPPCEYCSGIVKVATISFGQPMNERDMIKASDISIECDLMIVMGSSLKVMPAGKIPEQARLSGAKLVILNREKTPYDDIADVVINDELKNICSTLNELL